MKKEQKEIIKKIKQKIQSSSAYMTESLLAIYDKQTTVEQQSEETKDKNFVGFSGADGHILSSFAEQVIQSSIRYIRYCLRLQ